MELAQLQEKYPNFRYFQALGVEEWCFSIRENPEDEEPIDITLTLQGDSIIEIEEKLEELLADTRFISWLDNQWSPQ